jgi:hypothetical protein
MNGKIGSTFLFYLILGLALMLGGCNSQRVESVDAFSRVTPEGVVTSFYGWYMAYSGNPLADGAYHSSGYLTEDFIQRMDEVLYSAIKSGYDPVLCAQDKPKRISVEDGPRSEDQDLAIVLLHEVWNLDTKFEWCQDLTIRVILDDGTWKIDDINCGGSKISKKVIHVRPAEITNPLPEGPLLTTPEGVVNAFYSWYIWYAREVGNPLIDGVYRSSEYLDEQFVLKVDEVINSFYRSGFDPFLCTQDIPNSFTIEDASISDNIAKVIVHTSFEGHGFSVSLQKSDDRWEIFDIVCDESLEDD